MLGTKKPSFQLNLWPSWWGKRNPACCNQTYTLPPLCPCAFTQVQDPIPLCPHTWAQDLVPFHPYTLMPECGPHALLSAESGTLMPFHPCALLPGHKASQHFGLAPLCPGTLPCAHAPGCKAPSSYALVQGLMPFHPCVQRATW